MKEYNTLTVATEEETSRFVEEAKDFLLTTNLYDSYKSIAIFAIADYIASKNNKKLRRVYKESSTSHTY
jgi:hypothetical protein